MKPLLHFRPDPLEGIAACGRLLSSGDESTMSPQSFSLLTDILADDPDSNAPCPGCEAHLNGLEGTR